MREPEERREEKLEAREVTFSAAARRDRPHGKVYRWLDNFWYHHKWKTIIITFFAVVILVCTLQMCNKESGRDVRLLIVGPTSFVAENSGLSELEGLLSSCVPEDYNGDGKEDVSIHYYTVYSEEQIKAMETPVNTSTNANSYQQFGSYLQTGETSLLLLDPWIFEEKKGVLADLTPHLGEAPTGAVYGTVEGEDYLLGVRLGDTALYQNNSAYRVLPPDTVVCLLSKLVTTNEKDYQNAAALLAALVK